MKAKRQHFLPEFYLRGFTQRNLLWVYDREKREYRGQQPHNTAVIGRFYEVEGTDGNTYFEIEDFLGDLESRAAPAITTLERGGSLTPEQRLYFAAFIATLLFRTPKFERETEQIADATTKHLMKGMFRTVDATAAGLKRYGKADGITPESMFDFIHNEEYQVKGNRNIAVRGMLDQAEKAIRPLACMDWLIVHADERTSFITTDAPLGYIIPENLRGTNEPILGLLSEAVSKVVPLTQRIALVIGAPGLGFGHCRIPRQRVREINIAVAQECDRFVIGNEENLVHAIVKRSKVDTSRPGTRLKVDRIPHPNDPMREYLVSRRVPADAPDEPFKLEFGPDGKPTF